MRKNVFFQNLEIWIWDILEKTHILHGDTFKSKKQWLEILEWTL